LLSATVAKIVPPSLKVIDPDAGTGLTVALRLST
jgi:hypothetical protein